MTIIRRRPSVPGENFLRDIYRLLTKDAEKWNRTLLLAMHDEHGGFFDHVPPLAISSPVPPGALYQVPFESTGPRVPALIASPWIRAWHGIQGSDGPYIHIATAGGKICWNPRLQ